MNQFSCGNAIIQKWSSSHLHVDRNPFGKAESFLNAIPSIKDNGLFDSQNKLKFFFLFVEAKIDLAFLYNSTS